MNKTALIVIIIGILAISIIAIVYLESSNTQNEEATLLWEKHLGHFARDITVADGKVFMPDYTATLCFNSTNGYTLWRTSLQRNDGIEFYQNKVYTGSVGGVVNKLEKESGEVLAQLPAPVSSSFGSKTAPEFFLANSKVFAIRDGVAEYDANTEELFWKIDRSSVHTLGNASINAPESNYIFMYGNSRLNPNNGSTIWYILGWHNTPPIITQE